MSSSGRKVVIQESTSRRILEQGRIRLLCVALFFTLCFGSISAQLVKMMIRSPQLSFARLMPSQAAQGDAEGEETDVKSSEILSRGDIVDRNGVLVATSLMMESAFANPREMSDPAAAAAKLSATLGLNKDALLKRLKSDKSFIWIKRHLTPTEQQAVNTLGIPGVYFLPEERRVYPYGNVLSHVLGYVGVDNKGLAGMEKAFDQKLTGEATKRQPVELSVDIRLQHIIRDEMKKTMEEFKAIGATGIVMDVKSGEILAMSSLPDFDPHKPSQASDAQKFNRATLGSYEMGSTFKSFTTAMALDYGTVNMKGGYDATNPLKIATFTISDTHPKKRWLSVPEIYAYSSNIGTAKMALEVGAKKQRAFLDKIGMLKPIDIGLSEKAIPLYPNEWKDISTVTISYGHGISVSPLHLVRGIATLVDGGTMPQLTLTKTDGRKVEGERVVSENTSAMMRRLMRLVVKHGTASKADVPGYRVGGKTGTAEKVGAGGYNKSAKMALFVGTFPVDAPRYVVLVMIDEPQGNKSTAGYATGGWIAAPVVGKVVSRMAPVLGIAPVYEAQGDDAEQYWVDSEKKNVQTATVKKTTPAPTPANVPPLNKRYLHVANASAY